ncbi:MAG: hypothetical protein COA46_00755 [Porticoccaceae bacterium]|nr:MAG: hypothetical protein COA46_00755 [Porticoccaceae bacterium]
MKNFFRLFIQHSLAFLNSRPDLKHQCAILVRKLGLYKTLRSIYLRFSTQPLHLNQGYTAEPIADKHLTPRALRIYRELKAAIEERHREDD